MLWTFIFGLIDRVGLRFDWSNIGLVLLLLLLFFRCFFVFVVGQSVNAGFCVWFMQATGSWPICPTMALDTNTEGGVTQFVLAADPYGPDHARCSLCSTICNAHEVTEWKFNVQPLEGSSLCRLQKTAFPMGQVDAAHAFTFTPDRTLQGFKLHDCASCMKTRCPSLWRAVHGPVQAGDIAPRPRSRSRGRGRPST